jgi:hypothetical protein
MQNGQFGFAPGQRETLATMKGDEATAAEAAKAGQDVIQVTEGGRTRNVNRAQWLAEQQKQGAPGETEVVQAWREHQKNTPGQPFTFVRSQLPIRHQRSSSGVQRTSRRER